MPVREHLKKGGRDRVLSDEEIGVLWKELNWLDALATRQHQTPVSAAAFRLILLTAQRPGEVFRMRWRDLEDGIWWVIPAEVAKNGEFNRVPLSPQARKILHGLRPHTGGSEWVLESPYKAGSHLTTIKTASHGIVKRAGMRPWTPHDLRRTAVSKMRALGVDRRVVQAILNHKDSEITAVYDRYGMDPEKEQALSVWGRRVEEIVRPGGQGAVASFPLRSVLPGSSGSGVSRGRATEDEPHEDA
jgi:integrase